jgi:hypothetical protein
MRPRILATRQKIQGLRSVEEDSQSTRNGHGATPGAEVLESDERDLAAEPFLPASRISGRAAIQWQAGECGDGRTRTHREQFGEPARATAGLLEPPVLSSNSKNAGGLGLTDAPLMP